MMSDDSNAVVVYTAVCFNNPEKYMPAGGAPSMVEVAKVDYKARGMTQKEKQELTKKLQNAVDLYKAVLDVGKEGMKFFEDKKWIEDGFKDGATIVGGIGKILKGISKFIPGPPNPMIEKLQNLANVVEKMGKRMNENFDEMKSYISEVNFFIKIMSPTTVLIRYMSDCLENPGPQTLRNFKRAYETHPPLKLVYNLKSYLEQNSTNPLKMAMASEKSMSTLEKWENIISDVLKQFLLLEAFGSGLLGIKHTFNWDRLYDAIFSIFNSMAEWRREYEKEIEPDNFMWKEMKTFVDGYLASHKHMSLAEKADDIKKKMDSYYFKDAYYVCVFQSSVKNFHIHCPNKKDQLIEARMDDWHSIMIYRSCKASTMKPIEFENSKREVKACQKDILHYPGSLEEIVNDQLINDSKGRLVRRDGLVFILDSFRGKLEIRTVNCPGHEWGPGWWERDVLIWERRNTPHVGTPHTLLVGLP